MNALRIYFPSVNDFLDLSDNESGGCSHVCIEISFCFIEDEIAEGVCLFCLYECKISKNGLLKQILFAVELFDLFGLGGYLYRFI
jgi:hypothetical protein